MEAELVYETIQGYREVFSTLLQKESLQDCVVPDTMPDIRSLISTSGVPLIRSKDIAFGRIRIEANVPVRCAFYGEGNEIFCLDMNLPYYFNLENEKITDSCRASVELCAEGLETRLLNPRKISVRCVLNVSVKAYDEAGIRIPTDAAASDVRIHTLQKTAVISRITDVTEKTFVITDELALPDGVTCEELLGWNVELHPTEEKTVGSRAILKGCADSSVLFRSVNGTIGSHQFTTEFSQVAGLNTEPDQPYVINYMIPSGQYFEIIPGSDGKRLSVELHIVAEIIVYEKAEIRYLADAYSNMFQLEMHRETIDFPLLSDERQAIDSVILSIPLSEVPAEAMGCILIPIRTFTTNANAMDAYRMTVYWRDVNGTAHESSRVIPAEADADPAGEGGLFRSTRFRGITLNISADGAAVSAEKETRFTVLSRLEIDCISSVSYDASEPLDLSETPSLVLIRRKEDTDIWTLAKKNCSTVSAIETANSGEGREGGNLFLLIPRSI